MQVAAAALLEAAVGQGRGRGCWGVAFKARPEVARQPEVAFAVRVQGLGARREEALAGDGRVDEPKVGDKLVVQRGRARDGTAVDVELDLHETDRTGGDAAEDDLVAGVEGGDGQAYEGGGGDGGAGLGMGGDSSRAALTEARKSASSLAASSARIVLA